MGNLSTVHQHKHAQLGPGCSSVGTSESSGPASSTKSSSKSTAIRALLWRQGFNVLFITIYSCLTNCKAAHIPLSVKELNHMSF